MQHPATSTANRNARALRRDMTDSERKLWSGLRGEQLDGKFRRQHPLGNYIADFACLAPKLIVELDGSQHAEQADYDERRDAFFRGQGFAVLRFGSNEPFLNIEGVLTVIADALAALGGDGQPPSQPSPRGGRSEQPRSSL
jgi:very-short-patch-repair endonuclease